MSWLLSYILPGNQARTFPDDAKTALASLMRGQERFAREVAKSYIHPQAEHVSLVWIEEIPMDNPPRTELALKLSEMFFLEAFTSMVTIDASA